MPRFLTRYLSSSLADRQKTRADAAQPTFDFLPEFLYN
jgi:hypothetical protein